MVGLTAGAPVLAPPLASRCAICRSLARANWGTGRHAHWLGCKTGRRDNGCCYHWLSWSCQTVGANMLQSEARRQAQWECVCLRCGRGSHVATSSSPLTRRDDEKRHWRRLAAPNRCQVLGQLKDPLSSLLNPLLLFLRRRRSSHKGQGINWQEREIGRESSERDNFGGPLQTKRNERATRADKPREKEQFRAQEWL